MAVVSLRPLPTGSYLLLVALLVASSPLSTSTGDVPSMITTKAAWDSSSNPYNIESSSLVTSSGDIEVSAGTSVAVSANVAFTVRGQITILGSAGSPVVFEGLSDTSGSESDGYSASLLVMSETNLDLSSITHAHFKNAGYCILLNGDTSEHNPGEKNSGVLQVSHSLFENCRVTTSGYDAGDALNISYSVFKQVTFHSGVRTERINLFYSRVEASKLYHNAYHQGFLLFASTVYTSEFFGAHCCANGFQIKKTSIFQSTLKVNGLIEDSVLIDSVITNAGNNYRYPTIRRSVINTSSLERLPSTVQQNQYCPSTGKYGGECPHRALVYSHVTTLEDSRIECGGSAKGALPGFFQNGGRGTSTVTVMNVDFIGCSPAIKTIHATTIRNSNFYNAAISVQVLSSDDVDAEQNYWNGSTTASSIERTLEHFVDDTSLGLIVFTSSLHAPVKRCAF
eukprot:g2827.t1